MCATDVDSWLCSVQKQHSRVCVSVSEWAKVLEHCENVLCLDVTLFTVRKIQS